MSNRFDSNLLNPLESDEFLPPISRWAKLTGLCLAATFGVALGLSAVIKYSTTVDAMGMVRPASELQLVESATQGKVKSIDVKENQDIKAGDPIAKVDENPLKNQKNNLKKQIDQLSSQLAQLGSQINQYKAKNPDSSNIWYLFRRYKNLEEQLNNTQSQYYQVSQMLDNAVVRTPVSGRILKLDLQSIGQQVKTGQQVAQILPTNTSMLVKARVALQDIGQVQIGQTVQLRISAYPYPDYGVLQGKITSISADAITPQNSVEQSSPYYEVTIEPEKSFLVKSDRYYPLQPGMEVTANIISKEETFLSFILRKARLSTNL
ncbi:HlyD family efflux transporter periplasmic adaptor subunit [Floridanema evergladense]|uniref:HlyD family efflux transporter periplasmic adaptor subunit n=1 Tax=Floridaenema evergladense BLCC-F167 TaxID=3153639 RepID=A0ABV4WXK6_9CYAN